MKIPFEKGVLSVVLPCLLFGAEPQFQIDDDALLASISNDMLSFEMAATTTKRNQLYQPYILSVFEGHDLERLGISNLEEALRLVPGVDIASDNINYKSPIFRGSNPEAYGQSKLFIDDIAVNDLFFDGYAPYLAMPIEMIKRIEVVRGPGSQLDGVNAYAGSIHVITYAEEIEGFESQDQLVFKTGSYDYVMGGFIKTFRAENFKFYSDFSYQHDNKKIFAGPDAASQNIFGSINAPLAQSAKAPLWSESYNLGVTLSYEDFTLKGRILEHTQGSAYGINYLLPEEKDRLKLPNYYVELGYGHSWGDYDLEIKAGTHYDSFDSRAHLSPAGLMLPSLTPPTQLVVYSEGFYGIHKADQLSLYQSTFLKYRGFDSHLVTFGYRLVSDKTTYQSTETTDRDSGSGIIDYSATYPFFDEDAKRESVIVSVQDRFDYSDQLSFIYGVTSEKRSDMDIQIDPRISMVYQADSQNIFKAMYSKSHRNPSWQEMYTLNNRARVGNPDLDPERVNAFEMVYIRKLSTANYWQTNLFYLLNSDQINKANAQSQYINATDSELYGLETELKSSLSSKDQIYLNYSYVGGTTDIDNQLSNVASHMAKGYYIYQLFPHLSVSGIVKYIGSKERTASDSREALKAYTVCDAAIDYEDTRYDYSVTLSLKNLFDADIYYPAAPLTYSNDYPQEGRNFLVTLRKSF